MKIMLEGDMDENQLRKLGKFMVNMYAGKKEHMNMLVLEGTEKMDVEKVKKIIGDMWK